MCRALRPQGTMDQSIGSRLDAIGAPVPLDRVLVALDPRYFAPLGRAPAVCHLHHAQLAMCPLVASLLASTCVPPVELPIEDDDGHPLLHHTTLMAWNLGPDVANAAPLSI